MANEPTETTEQLLRTGAADDPLHALQARYGNADQFKLRVYRLHGAGEDEYLFSADGFVDEDFIQAEHGAGRYKLKIYIGDEWRDDCTIRIAARPGANPAGAAVAPGAAPAAAPPANDFAQQLLLAMVNNGALGGGAAPAGAGAGIADMVKAIGLFKELLSPSDPMKYYLDGIAEGKNLGGGADDWKKELATTIKEVAPTVAAVFRPAAPAGAQPVHQQPTPEQQKQEVHRYVQHTIGRIKPQVSMGLDPGLAIDWLLQNASDPAMQPFLQLAINEPFEQLQTLDGDLAKEPYEAWFRSVYDGIRSAYSVQDPVDADTVREFGNEGDSVGDEDVGASGDPAA